jgi:hypothetical protein
LLQSEKFAYMGNQVKVIKGLLNYIIKHRIKIRFFTITLRVSITFSISFLNLIGKMQILWKESFSNKQVLAPGVFWANLMHYNFILRISLEYFFRVAVVFNEFFKLHTQDIACKHTICCMQQT